MNVSTAKRMKCGTPETEAIIGQVSMTTSKTFIDGAVCRVRIGGGRRQNKC